jgi:hypothetical protein
MILQKQVNVIHKKVGPTQIEHRMAHRAWRRAQTDEFKAESSSLKGQRKTIYWAISTTPTIHKIPLIPPFAKGGNCYPPLWKRGARGDFLIKPLNISVLHRAINAICRSSIRSFEAF